MGGRPFLWRRATSAFHLIAGVISPDLTRIDGWVFHPPHGGRIFFAVVFIQAFHRCEAAAPKTDDGILRYRLAESNYGTLNNDTAYQIVPCWKSL